MRLTARTVLLVIVGSAGLLTACAGGGGSIAPSSQPSATPHALPGILAMAVNVPTSPTAGPLGDALDLAFSAGVRGLEIADTWSTLGPSPNSYNFSDLSGSVGIVQTVHPFHLLFGIQVINTTAKELPSDLEGLPFDDPRVESRFHALLAAARPYLASSSISYLSIGNEVNVYLDAHPDQSAAYSRFYNDALNYAHSILPGLPVGVTFTSDALLGSGDARAVSLMTNSDVAIVTYYPLAGDYTVRSPSAPLADIPAILAASGTRPVVFQEAGYPTAALLNSSETAQAQFVTNLFRAWRANGSRIPWMSYFVLYDESVSQCDAQAAYYGFAGNANLIAYLCSLGLRNADGSAKTGWNAFTSQTGAP